MNRFIERFRQFGGLRLVWIYIRMGLFGELLRQGWRMLTRRTTAEQAYAGIIGKVSAKLYDQYRPLMLQRKEYYDRQELEHPHAATVWTCWLQGIDKAPRLVKTCVSSMRQWLDGRDVVVITYDNYRDYVELPQHVVEKYERGIITAAHFSDMLRLQLLTTYGGTWMDATVLCTGNNYPGRVMNCDLFLFQQYQKGIEGFVGISNWFITSCANNPVLLILRDLLFQYWKDYNCTVQYYIFHAFFGLIAQIYPQEVMAMPRGNRWWTLQLGIRIAADYDPEWMTRLTDTCCFHKLNYRKEKEAKANPNSYYSHIFGKYPC